MSTPSRKIFVTATRKLRTWNPDTGWSATKTPSRSIAWAIADASRNTEYGAGLPDSRIDLAGLYALDQLWENRNNHFDGRFDSAITWWETISQIAKVGRAKPFMQSAILYVARDSAKTVPVAKFTMRNICRGSFNLEFVLPGAAPFAYTVPAGGFRDADGHWVEAINNPAHVFSMPCPQEVPVNAAIRSRTKKPTLKAE